MPKRKVRHSLLRYYVLQTNSQGQKQKVFETAFRNQIVDIPEDQVDRLDDLGATVPVDEDLPRPGTMLVLPDTATDEEILSWVMGASNDEVEALVRERPVMAARIEGANAAVQARFAEQNLHLGGLREIADEAEAEQEEQRKALEAAGTPPPGTPPAEPALSQNPVAVATPPAAGAEPVLSVEQADAVVKGNAKAVAEYISENPRTAAAVLDAEGRLAAAEQRDARISVVRAAEAAAGFTAQ